MAEKTLKRKDLNLVLAKIAEKWQGNGDCKSENKMPFKKQHNSSYPTPQKQKMHRENTLFLYTSPTYALHAPS